MTPEIGEWQSDWNGGPTVFSRQLAIPANAKRGTYKWEDIKIRNLAGIITNSFNSGSFQIL